MPGSSPWRRAKRSVPTRSGSASSDVRTYGQTLAKGSVGVRQSRADLGATRWVGRAAGKAGDELFVTGRLGGSLRGSHLKFVPRIVESRWLTKNFPIHAMMDLSDGLGVDLSRLARASRVGLELDEAALPLNRGCTIRQAISDGEDYELLFTLAPKDARILPARWRKKFPRVALTRIGRLNRKSVRAEQTAFGNRKFSRGYVHFKKS